MVDLDALGGVATGGLIASQFEKPTGEAGEHHTECADCGTETVGRFCHNCGNPSHVHRTLLHLGEELLHGVMHFDSRTWRTLPLLAFRPGRLTREWVMGKRTRYVSPLALFLFTIFVMFMAISYLPKPKENVVEQQAVAAAKLAKRNTDVANAKAALAKARTPEAQEDAQSALTEAQGEAVDAATDLRDARRDVVQVTTGAKAPGDRTAGDKVVVATDWKKELAKQTVGKNGFSTGNAKLDEKLQEKLDNPELAIFKLQQAFYKFSFLLAPISIPFVALLFLWKKGFTLYDHGVFVLYSITFMSLLVMVLAVATRIGGMVAGLTWLAAWAIVPAHMFFQLKGAYGLKTGSALWRTVFLMIFSVVALLLFIAAILWFETQV
ncbi:DUF3667 domain-containing protein [Phenylobacterium sp.]|uniref:DUF3667 domain-containing protein n=1 Tax=Phenylobacterium sp. TaxID=1871053 RepID=UPI0025F46036|nr:DUF3667 domain-containing protein [Phenylobacterium sp.]